jgi:hypothetical protein
MAGKAAGLTEEQTIEIRRGQVDDSKLDTLAKVAREAVENTGTVGDATWQAALDAGWSDTELADAFAAITLNLATTYFHSLRRHGGSVCTRVIERLYGNSAELNDAGQYKYYGRVGGCIVTGNEDGAKHCAMNILYSLRHLGYTIPPPGRRGLGWRGRAWAVLPRPRLRRAPQRLHQPQRHLHDLEPPAPGPHAEGRRRHPRAREPAIGLGRADLEGGSAGGGRGVVAYCK